MKVTRSTWLSTLLQGSLLGSLHIANGQQDILEEGEPMEGYILNSEDFFGSAAPGEWASDDILDRMFTSATCILSLPVTNYEHRS